jgi:hypothetical protein
METDANMSDASASSKRLAPAGKQETPKKRNDTAQHPTARQTRFEEIEVNETIVSTKPNKHIDNPYLESLPESMLKLAKSPYEALYSEDSGDPKAFHDDLQTLL